MEICHEFYEFAVGYRNGTWSNETVEWRIPIGLRNKQFRSMAAQDRHAEALLRERLESDGLKQSVAFVFQRKYYGRLERDIT